MKKFAKESFFTSIWVSIIFIAFMNMKKIICLAILAFLLSACFSKAETEPVSEDLWATQEDTIPVVEEEALVDQTDAEEISQDLSPSENQENTESAQEDVSKETDEDNQDQAQQIDQTQEDETLSTELEAQAEATAEQESINESIDELQKILTGEDIDAIFEDE